MKYGLIGHPVGHSYSKMIHEMLGNEAYEIIDVLPEQLDSFFQKKEYAGWNVTLPYKERVIPYLDEVEAQAAEIGAVNTIVVENGRLKGYNTDYYGFRALLLRHCTTEELKGKTALIFGTGGTSKTVAKVLCDLGVECIYKVSRSHRGENIVSMAEAAELEPWIVVNTTPVGMYPNDEEHCIPLEYREQIYGKAGICLDVVYRPTETIFIKEALQRGILAEGGLYMLVAQAVYGARLFYNKDISEEKIQEIFFKMQEYLQEEMHICVTEKLQGKIEVPPSKSYSHRHLILAAMASGNSVLHGVGKSQDIDVTIQALKVLGAKFRVLNENERERTLEVDGTAFLKNMNAGNIYCRESGSSLRFLLPLALLNGRRMMFTGESGLMRRPMDVYESICSKQGIFYEKKEEGIVVQGRLSSGCFNVPGNISSQFITGLLFVLPFLEGKSEIRILPPVESLPYIDMTIEAMKQWGIVGCRKENVIFVPGGQRICPREIAVEKDFSNGAYLWAYNALGHSLQLEGLEKETLQGDQMFREIFERLKSEEHPTIAVENTPDLVPIAMAVSACFSGAVFMGTKRLEMKESNRGCVMAQELKKFGIHCVIEENQIEVYAGMLQQPAEPLCGHEDHRIVMALCLLLTITGGTIKGHDAVRKSFPTYFEDLTACGLEILKKQ